MNDNETDKRNVSAKGGDMILFCTAAEAFSQIFSSCDWYLEEEAPPYAEANVPL